MLFDMPKMWDGDLPCPRDTLGLNYFVPSLTAKVARCSFGLHPKTLETTQRRFAELSTAVPGRRD